MTGPEEIRRELEEGFGVRYARGLRASASSNASAYGYSVTITAAFGISGTAQGTPGFADVFAFAGGAVAAFALVEGIVTGGFRRGFEDEPDRVRALGSSISIFSVGSALALAFLVGLLLDGFLVWPLASFLATTAYLFAFALELRMAEWLQFKLWGNPRASEGGADEARET